MYQNLRKHRCSTPYAYYAVTVCTNNRRGWFKEFTTAHKTITLLYNNDRNGHTFTIAYVLMPDHLHWLFQLQKTKPLSKVIQGFKSQVSQYINKQQAHSVTVWQRNFYDHQIKNERDLYNQARYIVANPLRAGICISITQYSYWNCIYLNP
jgi:REP element-mobilizing transposase RayT